MAFFANIRPLLRIATALEDIAHALNYFAAADARANKRMYLTRPSKTRTKDESELFHSDPATIARLRAEEELLIEQKGYSAIDNLENTDD